MPTRSTISSTSRDNSLSRSPSRSPVDQTKYDCSTAQDPGADRSSSPVNESPPPSSPFQASDAVPSASNTNSPEALESKHSSSPIDLALPDGIILPKSVDPNFFSQNRLRTSFNELSSSQMTAALEEYDIAMRSKGETVRNPQAYFFGVIKRYLNLPKNNSKDSSDINSPMGENLSVSVKVSFHWMYFRTTALLIFFKTLLIFKIEMSDTMELVAFNSLIGTSR